MLNFFECVEVAKKKHDISFVIKGILKLENQIAELEMKKRKLNC